MKEKYLKLRDLTASYSESKKEFETRRKAFDEAIKNNMVLLESGAKVANYDSATEFYAEYSLLVEYAATLKEEHPRYGEKRVKDELTAKFKATDEYKDRALYAGQIVDTYLTFENAGYAEVREMDVETKRLAIALVEGVDTAKNEVVDTTVAGVNKALEQAKPYTEKAKKAVNTGAKVLIKILQQVDSKKD